MQKSLKPLSILAAVGTTLTLSLAVAPEASATELQGGASSVASGWMLGENFDYGNNPQGYHLYQFIDSSSTWKVVPGAFGSAVTLGVDGYPWWIDNPEGNIYTTHSLSSPNSVIAENDFGDSNVFGEGLTSIGIGDANHNYDMWILYYGAPYVNALTQTNLNVENWVGIEFNDPGSTGRKTAVFGNDEVQCYTGGTPIPVVETPVLTTIHFAWILDNQGLLFQYAPSTYCADGSFVQQALPPTTFQVIDIASEFALTSDGTVWQWSQSTQTWSSTSYGQSGLMGIGNGKNGLFEVNTNDNIFAYNY
jgi:hypothetical protein